MASTITASTLKVTIEESIDLGGVQRNSKNTLSIAGIKNIHKRIVTCPKGTDGDADGFASDGGGDVQNRTTLLSFQADVHTASGPHMDLQNTKYIRITNLDNTESIAIQFMISADEDGGIDSNTGDEFIHLLEAGKSLMLGSPHDSVFVDDGGASYALGDWTTAIGGFFDDLHTIKADPGLNDIDVEVYVAST